MLTSLFDGRQELAQYATSAINLADYLADYQAYRQLTYLPNQVAGLYGQLLAQNLYQAGNKETKVSGHLKGLQAKLYFHSDYQNSTLRVSGGDSQNNYGFRYNAFGVVSSQYQNGNDDGGYSASSIHTRTNNLVPYQYTGKYRESISGLNQMDARWYNPKVGRFIQPDQYNHVNLMLPKGAQSELVRYIGRTQNDLLKDPAQQMRYGYGEFNQLRFIDPTGLDTSGVSLNLSGGFGFGLTLGVNVAWDDDGNIALQVVGAVGAESPSVSTTVSMENTNADTVLDLAGRGTQFGADVSVGGIGVVEGGAMQGQGYTGTYRGVGVGIGTPIGGSGYVGGTGNLVVINPAKIINDVIDFFNGSDKDSKIENRDDYLANPDLSGHRNIPC